MGLQDIARRLRLTPGEMEKLSKYRDDALSGGYDEGYWINIPLAPPVPDVAVVTKKNVFLGWEESRIGEIKDWGKSYRRMNRI